jgi:hypothetical protein
MDEMIYFMSSTHATQVKGTVEAAWSSIRSTGMLVMEAADHTAE